jgi:hypothetical protein
LANVAGLGEAGPKPATPATTKPPLGATATIVEKAEELKAESFLRDLRGLRVENKTLSTLLLAPRHLLLLLSPSTTDSPIFLPWALLRSERLFGVVKREAAEGAKEG